MKPIAELRADTPGCSQVVHLNNAGASLPPSAVVERVIEHLRLEASIGGYEAAADVAVELDSVHATLAAVIGAHSDEIALMDSATRAWLAAFSAIDFRPGERILTASSEYSSNVIAMLAAARRHGVRIESVPSTASGEICLDALEAALGDDVRLVAITHAPSTGGLLQPVKEIGRLLRAHRALFLVDACQSVGQVPIDVAEMGIDLLSATGRKFLRAPRGTGFLYVRRDLIAGLEPIHIDLHSAETDGSHYRLRADARRFELWESNVAATLGLGVAARYYTEVGIAPAWERIRDLAGHLREGLGDLPGVELTDHGTLRSGIVTFRVDGVEPADLVMRLRRQRIHLVASTAASTPWDMRERGLDSVLRASAHYYNDTADLQALIDAVRDRGL